MDYETLRRLQRTERNNADLASLPEDFYTQLAEYINSLVKEYKRTGSPQDIMKLENVIKISKDIFQRRSQKMLLHALRTLKENSNSAPELVEIEKKCYRDIVSSLEEMNGEFEKVLTGERPVLGTEAAEEASKALEKIEEIGEPAGEEQTLNSVLVRILQNVPKFVSSDMQEYGPFQPRDLVRLPEKEARLLIERGFAEKV